MWAIRRKGSNTHSHAEFCLILKVQWCKLLRNVKEYTCCFVCVQHLKYPENNMCKEIRYLVNQGVHMKLLSLFLYSLIISPTLNTGSQYGR